MQTFSKKELVVEVITDKGQVYEIKDFAVKASIEVAGLPSLDNASIRIYGLSLELMQQISFIQYKNLSASDYVVNLYAIEDDNKKLAFTGNIVNAFPVFLNAPDVFFNIEAISNYASSLTLKNPLSFQGSVKIQDIAKSIVKTMDKSFTNNGVDITDDDVYLDGSPVGNLNTLSTSYNYDTVLDKNSITITPKGQPIEGTLTVIDCNDNLVNGYIENSQDGIYFATIYNSTFQLQGKIRVLNSYNSVTNGDWVITGITHSLTSRINGEWFSNIKASYFQI